MLFHLQISKKNRHSLLPSGAHKVILVLMTSHSRQIPSFCFSFLQNDFPKADVGQNATNTAIKPPQCLKGGEQIEGQVVIKLTDQSLLQTPQAQLLVFINSSSTEHSSPTLVAQNTKVFSSMNLKGWPALTFNFQKQHLYWSFLWYPLQSGNSSYFSV